MLLSLCPSIIAFLPQRRKKAVALGIKKRTHIFLASASTLGIPRDSNPQLRCHSLYDSVSSCFLSTCFYYSNDKCLCKGIFRIYHSFYTMKFHFSLVMYLSCCIHLYAFIRHARTLLTDFIHPETISYKRSFQSDYFFFKKITLSFLMVSRTSISLILSFGTVSGLSSRITKSATFPGSIEPLRCSSKY